MSRWISLCALVFTFVTGAALAGEPSQLPAEDFEPRAQDAPIYHVADAKLTANQIVEGMQKYYETVEVYSAQFEQTIKSKRTGRARTSKGEVWFMKPGRMRWDYLEPDERYLISNGETFWSWEPNQMQYCEQDLTKSTLPTALSFLSGTGDLRIEFNSALVEWPTAGEHRVQLTPKNANSNYKNIDFVVDANTFQVKQAIFTDGLNNLSTLAFIDAVVNGENEDADPSSFEFKPPAGASELCGQFQP